MDKQINITGNIIFKNTAINFVGKALPSLVGIITIPFIVQGLGTERFGILSLAWVVLGYFAVFDLGLGRATTKFVAVSLGKGDDDQVPPVVWTAVTVQMIFGIVGGLFLLGITPFLVERILNIPQGLLSEAKASFHLLALSVPIVLVSSSFRGVLEASQRFDLVNSVKIPSNALIFFLPLLGLFLGFDLPGIVSLILISRFGALLALFAINLWLFPNLKKFSAHFSIFPSLFNFGKWIMTSSIIIPILLYLDRFVIGSLISISAVSYYTIPYEIVNRLWIIPFSLITTLFPAFSTINAAGDKQQIETLFFRSIKFILLIMGPLIVILILFSGNILQIWIGSEIAEKSMLPMQILAVGVLVVSLSNIPLMLLQGVGRPDIPTKFLLLETPIYILLLWGLVSHYGIVGAALASSLRIAVDALLLFIASFKLCRLSIYSSISNGVTSVGFNLIFLIVISYILKNITNSLNLFVQSIFFIILYCLFAWRVWKNTLDISERNSILKTLRMKGRGRS